MEIEITGYNQFFHLHNEDYSAYPVEQEVLLQEGIQYKVSKIDEKIVDREIGGETCKKKLTIASPNCSGSTKLPPISRSLHQVARHRGGKNFV